MHFIELIIIAIGVSMDAFAVSICKGLSVRRLRPTYALSAAAWFGGFQALMPLIGYFVGISFADMVSDVDHWIAFVLLAFIGGKMIKEACQKEEETDLNPDFSFKTMFMLAVATSIDALAVGVTLAAKNCNFTSTLTQNILFNIVVIGITTFIISVIGVKIGNVFGSRYKQRAEIAGGVILILIGLKMFIEHFI
jgi:putative Mn2+ efflux pump MntP